MSQWGKFCILLACLLLCLVLAMIRESTIRQDKITTTNWSQACPEEQTSSVIDALLRRKESQNKLLTSREKAILAKLVFLPPTYASDLYYRDIISEPSTFTITRTSFDWLGNPSGETKQYTMTSTDLEMQAIRLVRIRTRTGKFPQELSWEARGDSEADLNGTSR